MDILNVILTRVWAAALAALVVVLTAVDYSSVKARKAQVQCLGNLPEESVNWTVVNNYLHLKKQRGDHFVIILILPVIGNLFVNSNVILLAALTKCKGKISEGKEKNTNTAVLGHHVLANTNLIALKNNDTFKNQEKNHSFSLFLWVKLKAALVTETTHILIL